METKEQKLLIQGITKRKDEILGTQDREKVIMLVREVILIAKGVAPAYSSRWDNKKYKDISKAHALELLNMDLQGVIDGSYYDFELVHFQVGITLLMLTNVFLDGGSVNRIEEICSETVPTPYKLDSFLKVV